MYVRKHCIYIYLQIGVCVCLFARIIQMRTLPLATQPIFLRDTGVCVYKYIYVHACVYVCVCVFAHSLRTLYEAEWERKKKRSGRGKELN